MRRALAEHRGGALAQAPSKRGDDNKLQRTLALGAEVAEARLSTLLRQSGLQAVERAPHATRWVPDSGLLSTLGRALNWRGSGAFIGAEIESSVYAVADGRCSAELQGRAAGTLAPVALVTGALLALPAAVAMLVILVAGLSQGFSGGHSLALVLVMAIWAALTALVTSGVSRRRGRKLRRALERILGQISSPGALPH